ncbi:MAG: hypothetical protein H5U05_06250 [Candidatus Aminicenantes bacterium]|nr:hypothetical protein [Candidatus Aminicenantes bacterium]
MKRDVYSGSALPGQQRAVTILLAIIFFAFLSQAACSRQEPASQNQTWTQEEIIEDQKPAPPPPPKITEEIYVEITARAALIFDKYKEDLDEAHRQMDLVYQKFGVSFADYDRYRKSLPADKKRQLEKQVQEFIQKIYKEYF